MPEPAKTVEASAPSVGDRFAYAGDDGSRLEGRFISPAIRTGPDLRPTEALILRFNLSYNDFEYDKPMTVAFEEAILPSGQILQQVAECATFFGSPVDQPAACLGNRSTVLFGAAGLPGAFGAGLLWAGSPSSPVQMTSATQSGVFTYARSEGAGSCQTWTQQSPLDENPGLRALPWTWIGNTRIRLCSSPVPAEFLSAFPLPYQVNGRRQAKYTLESYEPASGDAWPARDNGSFAPSLLLPLGPVGQPSFAAMDADLTFPPSEAHEQARRLSPEYAALAERPNSGLLFYTQYATGTRLSVEDNPIVGPREPVERLYDATLILSDLQSSIQVTIEKSIIDAGGIPIINYSLREQRQGGVGGEPWLAAGANLSDALDLALRLTSNEFRPFEMVWLTHESLKQAPTWVQRDAPPFKAGHTLIVATKDPETHDTTAQDVFYPYHVMFDGQTGLLIQIDVLRQDLPFDNDYAVDSLDK